MIFILFFIKKSILTIMSNELITRLTLARIAAKLTQAELAERAGLSRMTVQRLEGVTSIRVIPRWPKWPGCWVWT